MMNLRTLLLISSIWTGVCSYKFLVYSPRFGHSHSNFMGRIADTLFEAGHQVTVLSPVIDETFKHKTGVKSGARIIHVDVEPRTKELMAGNRMQHVWTMNPNPFAMLSMVANFTKSLELSCESTISNTELMESLRAEKFDVGIAEPFTLCGLGIIDHLGIPSSIGSLSTAQLDIVSWYLGEPVAASYVPSMRSSDGEKMSFMGRFKNAIGAVLSSVFFYNTYTAEADAFTRVFKKDYSNFGDLIGKTSFMFTNSNPYLNYPRPVLQKTVEIGGISIDVENVGELGETWDKVLNERKHAVFISFGSMAKSKEMPVEWKNSILEFCASMPEVTFIWKYEEPSDMANHLPNVHLSPWLPQNALLADPRLSLFITHGGLGSTTEVAYFGKPAIMLPLFGDQTRNAEMLARHGGALVLQKTDLGNPEIIRNAVKTIINDNSYVTAATRLANMLRNKPLSPKELVISHCEFAAGHGAYIKLDPYGRQLNIFQYYLVDVFAAALTVIAAFVFGFIYVVRLLINKFLTSKKVKVQ